MNVSLLSVVCHSTYLVQLCNEKNTISLCSPCPIEYIFFKGDLIKVAATQTTYRTYKQLNNELNKE